MISDVLSETVNSLDHYLNDPVYYNVYAGEIRDRILLFRKEAKAIQEFLDESPE